MSRVLFALLVVGCTHRVQVEVAATPTVSLHATTVAVVAADRSCKSVADALVSSLREVEGLRVDPRASTSLQVTACGRAFQNEVEIDQRPQPDGTRSDRRRVTVQGRSHAIVGVTEGGRVVATLLGTANQHTPGAWQDIDVIALRSAVDRALDRSLADDLALQISPLPRIVARRTWPGAPEGSARHLATLAVRAELRGDLTTAYHFALAASDARPSARTTAYVLELEHRLASHP